jgi:hypothetical protein
MFFVALALAAAPLFAGETVSDQRYGLRFTVPDGFTQDGEKVKGDVLFAFQKLLPGENLGRFILVRHLGHVIGREKLDLRLMRARFVGVTIVTENWKDLEIEVTRVPERIADAQLLTFNAQVPLKPEAIQLTVTGEAAREAELRGALRTVLASLEGRSNWLTTEERVDRGATRLAGMAITLAVVLFFAGVVWRAARGRQASPKDGEPGHAGESR